MYFFSLLIQLCFLSYFISTSRKRQFSYTVLYGTILMEYNKSPFTPRLKVIMGLSGSTVIFTTNNCLRQLSASSLYVYKFIGVVTAPPFGQSRYTLPKSYSPLNQQYHLPF